MRYCLNMALTAHIFWKAFIVLHTAVHMKSYRNTCIKNKSELEREFKIPAPLGVKDINLMLAPEEKSGEHEYLYSSFNSCFYISFDQSGALTEIAL